MDIKSCCCNSKRKHKFNSFSDRFTNWKHDVLFNSDY